MKTKFYKRHSFLAIVVFGLITGSCTPAYIPNVVNSPMFSNKYEFNASLHGGISGFDAQLAYAVTDHFGIMTNGSFADRTSDSTDNFHKHSFVEMGAGYFDKIGPNGRFEVYGGFGMGRVQAFYENEIWYDFARVKYRRFFIQPAIGAASGVFDGSFATRLVVTDFYQGSAKNTGVFVEPVVTAKVGYKYVKSVFQLGFSLPLNGHEVDYEYQPFIFTVGIQANIGRIFDE